MAVPCLIRHADKIAVIVEAPGMVEALQNIGMALIVAANQRASMCACVQEDPHLAIVAAHEKKRPPGHASPSVVARVLYFRLVAHIEPGLVEYPFLLHLKNLG